MKKNRKKKLLIPLLLSFILFITTSYAWFTSNRVVSIDTLDVHVQADGGLEISTDAVNWKQVITVQDLINARDNYSSSVNQVPTNFNPVSTGGNVNNGKLEMFRGEATNTSGTDFILVANKSTEEESFGDDSEGSFIAFDIFLRTTSVKELYVSGNSSVTALDESKGIENAVRIAFLNEGTSSDNASLGQKLNSASRAYIWEPNYDVHTEYGVKNALNVYGINTTMSGGSKLPYYGVISDIKTSANVLLNNANSNVYPNYFKSVNTDFATSLNNKSNFKLFDLNPSITKIRIYMWLEGQDVDCEDNASYGDISFKLELTTNPS